MELSRIFKKPLTRQVPHYLLIIMKKIWKIEGISHKITNQIQSFQTNRSQRVAVRGALFTELPVSSGVPQQSLLGPTLFLNYINDLPKTVLCNVRLYYADDTLLYSEVSSKQEKQLFQLNINALHDWSTKWKMLFNTNECQIIAFSSNKTQADPIFMLGGNSLRYVQEAGYLWIEIQSNLRFDKHVFQKIKDASKVLGCIKFTLHEAPENGKLLACTSFCRPILEYGLWRHSFGSFR